MRFAAVQFDIAWEDKAANHATIERMLREAAPKIVPGTFILLPELGDTGFSMNLQQIIDDRSLAWAQSLAARMGVFVQHGFARRGPDGKGRNCAATIDPSGELLALYEKMHPFSYGKEALHYSGGEGLVLPRCGETVICPLLCYDLRFPELWRHAALAGTEVFTIGASWPAARQHHWRTLLIARAVENQAAVVAVNRVGDDPHLSYAGGSMIISPRGELLAEADNTACVLQADVDLHALRAWRAEFPALRDARPELLGSFPEISQAASETITSGSIPPRS